MLISGNTEIIFFEQKTDTITYITSPEGLTAIVVASSNTPGREWYWIFTDHLGSIITLIRNSDGQKFEMSYDVWGNRRDPATWDNYNGTLPSIITDRGYTGHSLSREERNGKHLDVFGLFNPDTLHFIALSGLAASNFSFHFIHKKQESANMNGRMYDPQTTRFLSPDPIVADPTNPAGYNPYAYVLNNPLKYTDPSGYVLVTIAAYAIAATIIYLNVAKTNGDPATGKREMNPLKWFAMDKPGFTVGAIYNTSFTSSTYYAGMNSTNGGGGTVGYNTQYGWGAGSSSQNMYFPNYNASVSEAIAVNNIAGSQHNNTQFITDAADNYMNMLAYSGSGNWLTGIEVVWNGKYGSGQIRGGVPEWWGGGANSYVDGIPDFVSNTLSKGIPVAYSLEFTGATESGGASSMSPWGGILIISGPDKWNYKNFSSAGIGGGWISASVMGVGYTYFYTGNINNLSMKTFEGWGNNLSVSADIGFAAGGNVSWVENPNAQGEYLIGIGAGAGFGVGPTMVSGQYTRKMTHIYW